MDWNEEAIEYLEREQSFAMGPPDEGQTEEHYMLGLAISALEKQIAKKIEKDIVIDEDYGGNTYEREIPVCPSCNYTYLMLKQPYCDQCGQKLDWSVEE